MSDDGEKRVRELSPELAAFQSVQRRRLVAPAKRFAALKANRQTPTVETSRATKSKPLVDAPAPASEADVAAHENVSPTGEQEASSLQTEGETSTIPPVVQEDRKPLSDIPTSHVPSWRQDADEMDSPPWEADEISLAAEEGEAAERLEDEQTTRESKPISEDVEASENVNPTPDGISTVDAPTGKTDALLEMEDVPPLDAGQDGSVTSPSEASSLQAPDDTSPITEAKAPDHEVTMAAPSPDTPSPLERGGEEPSGSFQNTTGSTDAAPGLDQDGASNPVAQPVKKTKRVKRETAEKTKAKPSVKAKAKGGKPATPKKGDTDAKGKSKVEKKKRGQKRTPRKIRTTGVKLETMTSIAPANFKPRRSPLRRRGELIQQIMEFAITSENTEREAGKGSVRVSIYGVELDKDAKINTGITQSLTSNLEKRRTILTWVPKHIAEAVMMQGREVTTTFLTALWKAIVLEQNGRGDVIEAKIRSDNPKEGEKVALAPISIRISDSTIRKMKRMEEKMGTTRRGLASALMALEIGL